MPHPINTFKGKHWLPSLAQTIGKVGKLAETSNFSLRPGMGHCAGVDPLLHALRFCHTLSDRLLAAETQHETSSYMLWKFLVHPHFLVERVVRGYRYLILHVAP